MSSQSSQYDRGDTRRRGGTYTGENHDEDADRVACPAPELASEVVLGPSYLRRIQPACPSAEEATRVPSTNSCRESSRSQVLPPGLAAEPTLPPSTSGTCRNDLSQLCIARCLSSENDSSGATQAEQSDEKGGSATGLRSRPDHRVNTGDGSWSEGAGSVKATGGEGEKDEEVLGELEIRTGNRVAGGNVENAGGVVEQGKGIEEHARGCGVKEVTGGLINTIMERGEDGGRREDVLSAELTRARQSWREAEGELARSQAERDELRTVLRSVSANMGEGTRPVVQSRR